MLGTKFVRSLLEATEGKRPIHTMYIKGTLSQNERTLAYRP
jgi:hypothetical protein